MIIRQDPKELLIHQIQNLYIGEVSETSINRAYPTVIDKLETCFSHIKNKYYQEKDEPLFNPLHVAQWTMFLYEMAHEICQFGEIDLCDKIYGISKMISAADIFYGVNMPDIWFLDHPQGSVMGRAKYGNYFSFSQGCTVGNNKGIFPVLEDHVCMMAGAKILGDCHICDHVIVSADTLIIDHDIPGYSIVFGKGRDIEIRSVVPEQYNCLTSMIFNCTGECMEENT